jgi:predicted MPP superfamily phosphohydrolase
MLHIITGLICVYLVLRLVKPTSWSTGRKWLAALILLFISQYHLFVRIAFGTLVSPEWPLAVQWVMGWLFGGFILLATFTLFADIVAVVFRWLRRVGFARTVPLFFPRRVPGLCVLAFTLSGIGVWQAVRVPDVRHLEIPLARLPAELDGLRLVQISDLHASSLLRAPWVGAVVAKANALNPDLLLVTGDLIDGTPGQRAADVAPLRALKARLGVFAIPGNHEYYSRYEQWIPAFRKLGLHMLLNEHVLIRDRGRAFVLAGLTDRVASRFSEPAPNIAAALAGSPQGLPVILMAHQPGGAQGNARAGVDVQLSGHTHGGQIIGLNLLAKLFNQGFVSGLYRVGAMQLYVSSGTGLWGGFPIRLGAPSEITEIVLRAAPAAQAPRAQP